MIDHFSLPVSEIERARRLYDTVLGTLGYRRRKDIGNEHSSGSGYGPEGGVEPGFWIAAPKQLPGGLAPLRQGSHVAFHAASRAAVDAWHAAALAHGCEDNGPPGLRPHYGPTYYAAFAIDPDGNHIEAVCHRAE